MFVCLFWFLSLKNAVKCWLTVAAACAVPSAFVIPPSLLLTVIMFIPGEAAPAALSAHRRRAALPHQALQLREHHRRRGQEIARHAAPLPQPQVHTHVHTLTYIHTRCSVAPEGQTLTASTQSKTHLTLKVSSLLFKRPEVSPALVLLLLFSPPALLKASFFLNRFLHLSL